MRTILDGNAKNKHDLAMVDTLPKDRYFRDNRFPLAVIRSVTQFPMSRHAHQFSELVIVSKGSGVHVTGRESWPVSAGDVFVIGGARAHEYRDTDGLVLTNILYDPKLLAMPERDLRTLPGYHALFTLEPAWRARGAFKSRLKLSMKALAYAEGRVDKLERELSTRAPGFRFMALAAFMELVGALSRCYEKVAAASGGDLLRIGKAIGYLENHYADSVRLDDVAREVHLSKRHLLRMFKEATGLTPGAYLLQVRVARGAERLRLGEDNVTEAAWQAGFNDSNYFTRQFRRLMGMSPSEYRRRMAESFSP